MTVQTWVRRALVPVLVGWLGWSSGQALARPPDPREAKARAACAAGNVDRGVALLAEIAAETGDANALYNQARCYQQNGRTDEALEHFREYRRRVPNLPAEEAAQVDVFIQQLEAEQARKVQPSPVSATPNPPAPTAVAASPAPAPEPTTDAPSLRLLPTVLGGVSAAALVTGVFFSLKVRSIQSDLESNTRITAADLHDKEQSGQHAETYQWVSYGVAAAAGAGAVLTYVMGRPAPSGEPPRVGFLPMIGRDATGGVVRFAF